MNRILTTILLILAIPLFLLTLASTIWDNESLKPTIMFVGMGIFFILWISLSYGIMMRLVFRIKGRKIKANIIDYRVIVGENNDSYGLIVEYHVPEYGWIQKDLSKEQAINDLLSPYSPSRIPTIGKQISIYYDPKNPEKVIHQSWKGMTLNFVVWTLLASGLGLFFWDLVGGQDPE